MHPNIKTIYVAWRAGKGNRRIIVGKIKSNASRTLFEYIKSGVEEAREFGFVCFPDFPEIDRQYDKNVLRVLSQRFNNPERTDINDYYKFWEIPLKMAKHPIRVLALTGGSLPTDNFEFLADFYGSKDILIITELTGLSHNLLPNDLLEEGDELEWVTEPNNQYDRYAVAVYKNNIRIGYIKKIHNRLFYTKGAPKIRIQVRHIERNGHINKVYLLVMYDQYK